jgi:SprT protein
MVVKDIYKVIVDNNIDFKIVKPRKRILGTCYRNKNIITINNNLDEYSFLVVTLHELAHFFANKEATQKISPHGKQWQEQYIRLLKYFLYKGIFPKQIAEQVFMIIQKPKATFLGFSWQ